MEIGYDIDRFRVLSRLGQGRNTEVYKVIDTSTEQVFALKLFPSKFRHNPELLLQFREKVTTTARIFHKSVISIYNAGDHEKGLYFTMDFVNKRPFGDIFSYEAVIGLLLQIVSCLEHCHANNIFHRNLHPGNILVDPDRRVYLTDFGFRSVGAKLKNRSHILEGNPGYMAPEQFDGKDFGAATDIYSLGIILYEMVTKRLPFMAGDPQQVVELQRVIVPASPRSLNANVPPIWDELIMRCLEKRPDDRFQNMSQLREIFQVLKEQQPSIISNLPSLGPKVPERQVEPVANMRLIEEIEALVDKFENLVENASKAPALDRPAPKMAQESPGMAPALDRPTPKMAQESPGMAPALDRPAPKMAQESPGMAPALDRPALDRPAPKMAQESPDLAPALDRPAPKMAQELPGMAPAPDRPAPDRPAPKMAQESPGMAPALDRPAPKMAQESPDLAPALVPSAKFIDIKADPSALDWLFESPPEEEIQGPADSLAISEESQEMADNSSATAHIKADEKDVFAGYPSPIPVSVAPEKIAGPFLEMPSKLQDFELDYEEAPLDGQDFQLDSPKIKDKEDGSWSNLVDSWRDKREEKTEKGEKQALFTEKFAPAMEKLKKWLSISQNQIFVAVALVFFILFLIPSCQNKKRTISEKKPSSYEISKTGAEISKTKAEIPDISDKSHFDNSKESDGEKDITGSQIAPSRPVYTMNITTRPSGAAVIMDGRLLGKTPIVGANPESGEVQLIFSLPGYKNKEEKVRLDDKKTITHHSILEKIIGYFSIITHPADADIKIDGMESFKSPIISVPADIGPLKYQIKKPGYAEIRKEAEIVQDLVTTIEVELTPISSFFAIETEPSGAIIKIDNQSWGTSPVSGQLRMGKYQVMAQLPGFTDNEQTLNIREDGENKLEIRLSAQAQKVNIATVPSKAKIFIDGKERGVSPLIVQLYPGKYEIIASLAGFDKEEKSLLVEANKESSIKLNLKEKQGEAIIYSEPSGAQVFLNGNHIGSTPLIHDGIKAGHHILNLQDGPVSMTKEIQIPAGISTEFHINLLPEIDEAFISSTPSSAEVEINGKYYGNTPLKVKLAPGIYSAAFRKEGYIPVSVNITSSDLIRVTLPPTEEQRDFFFGKITHIKGKNLTFDRGQDDGVKKGEIYQIFTDQKAYKARFRIRKVDKKSSQGEVIGPYNHIGSGDGVISKEIEEELNREKGILDLNFEYTGSLDQVGPFFRVYDGDKLLGQAAWEEGGLTRITQEMDLGFHDLSFEIFERYSQSINDSGEGIFWSGFSWRSHLKTVYEVSINKGTNRVKLSFDSPESLMKAQPIFGGTESPSADSWE